MELNQARSRWIGGERQFVDDAIQRSILCRNRFLFHTRLRWIYRLKNPLTAIALWPYGDFAQKVLVLGFLCATSVSSVTLWCVFTRNSSTTETQSTQRLHREERNRDFLCKATRARGYVDQLRFDIRGHNAQCLNRVHDE